MEEDDDDECFVVDAIKSKRIKSIKIGKKGERQIAEYLIKWRNYSDSYNSWVDETQLSCFELISEFESREEERRKEQEERRKNEEAAKQKVTDDCVPIEIDEDVSEDPNNKTLEPATKENNGNSFNNDSVEVNGGNITIINNDTAGSSTPGSSTSTTPGPSTSTSPRPSTSSGPSTSTSPGPSTSTAQDETAVNATSSSIELYDVTQDKNGFELGLQMKAVIGMARDEDGVQVLVQFTTDDLELIPSTEVAKYAPIFLIEFYEKYIKFVKNLPPETPKKSNSKKRPRKY